jgi:AraC-like DNA-binding protein
MRNRASGGAPVRGRSVWAVASAAQVAIGRAALEPASGGKAFLRVARQITDHPPQRELMVLRSLLSTLVCRLALHVRPPVIQNELDALLSQLSACQSGHELRLAYEACILAIEAERTKPLLRGSIEDARINVALRYIRGNCCDHTVTLGRVAAEVSLSPWYFDRLLKRSTGSSYREHLRQARMSIAEQLLDRSFLSVKEVAAHVGYGTASDFDRDFRHSHRMTPTAWRHRSEPGEPAVDGPR